MTNLDQCKMSHLAMFCPALQPMFKFQAILAYSLTLSRFGATFKLFSILLIILYTMGDALEQTIW